MTTTTDLTTQVYRVYINAPAQKIWDAITTPEWNRRYGYGAPHPATAALTGGSLEESGAGGGWAWVLSDLKSLVETGKGFSA